LSRPLVTGVAAAGLLLAALVLLGRWEGERRVESESRDMEETRMVIGPLDSPTLAGYRVLSDLDCLVYRRGDNPFALELCVDGDGRVVETIDRRRFERRIGSLTDDPGASRVRVDRAVVDELLRRMGAPCCR
jgi:hypothetical protein